MDFRDLSQSASDTSRTTVGNPAAAQTWAMPLPIKPPPTTPTDRIAAKSISPEGEAAGQAPRRILPAAESHRARAGRESVRVRAVHRRELFADPGRWHTRPSHRRRKESTRVPPREIKEGAR